MSTIEAIARALGAIEGEDTSQHLCALYEKMVARAFPTRRRSAVGIALRTKKTKKPCASDEPVAG